MTRNLELVEASIRAAHAEQRYEQAATLLLEAYGAEVCGFLVSRLRDAVAADEVFSRFSEDLWRGLPGFEFRCPSRVWAYALARHAISRHIKLAQRERLRHVPLALAPSIAKIQEQLRSQTQTALKSETKSKISALRARLPPEDQNLLLLHVQRGLEFREIAQVTLHAVEATDEAALGRETARLRKRFQLIKERLRKMAQAEGLVPNDDA